MAYGYTGSCTTKEGKVIYRRKKHAFTVKDVLRIILKILNDDEEDNNFILLRIILLLLGNVSWEGKSLLDEEIKAIEESIGLVLEQDPEPFEGFSGGRFSGAGAWRCFPAWPMPPICIWIPEEE